MNTTVKVPASLYVRVVARAAEQGETVENFVRKGLQERLSVEQARPKDSRGWRAVFGGGRRKEIAAIQRVIDREFG